MGLAGSFVSVTGSIFYIQSLSMALAGAVMILTGLSIFQSTGSPFHRINFLRGFSKLMKKISKVGNRGSLFPLGLINGFIPCGLSYTAYIAAAGIGANEYSPIGGFLKGMLLLLIFGLGTLPSLLLLSQLVSMGISTMRKRLYFLAGLFLIISGMIFIYRSIHV